MKGKGMEYSRYVIGKEYHAFSPQIDQDQTTYVFFLWGPQNQVYGRCRITY